MKNTIKILLLAWVCMAISCPPKERENCHASIRFVNNSEMLLYVTDVSNSRDFDPLDIRRLYFQPLQKRIKCCEVNKDALVIYNRCYESIFDIDGADTIFVFIFDAAVVENTSWEVVARDYLVLKRYDLTLSDLQRLEWKITYPPTEAMKDVKQHPPFGSE